MFLWTAIAFLIYYLRQLLRENTRMRKLYAKTEADGYDWRSECPMKIHEYQAKQIFREAGVAVPRGSPPTRPRPPARHFPASA